MLATQTRPIQPQTNEFIQVVAILEFYPGVKEGGDTETMEFTFANNGKLIGPRLRRWVKDQYGDTARIQHWETIPSAQDIREELAFEFSPDEEF